ncbi:MAG: hypothetical protein ACLUQW_09990 [Collinsella sp.]
MLINDDTVRAVANRVIDIRDAGRLRQRLRLLPLQARTTSRAAAEAAGEYAGRDQIR